MEEQKIPAEVQAKIDEEKEKRQKEKEMLKAKYIQANKEKKEKEKAEKEQKKKESGEGEQKPKKEKIQKEKKVEKKKEEFTLTADEISSNDLALYAEENKNKEIYPPMNSTPYKYGVPEHFLHAHKPIYQVKSILRLDQVLTQSEFFIEKEGTVAGWAKTTRDAEKGKIMFIMLNDGSCQDSLQIVIDHTAKNFDNISKCGVQTSFRIRGKFVKSQGKGQTIEMVVNGTSSHYCKILGVCDNKEYPLAKKYHAVETLRQKAHLRIRSNLFSSVMRVRNALAYASHLFYQNRGFYYIHTPIITASDCEGAGEMFQVSTQLPPKNAKVDIDYSKEFFKKPAFLTVSGQLNVECFSCGLSNVYTFGPTFRAEVSHTTRHLAEFWMIEPEISFADLDDLMELAEDYLRFLIEFVLVNCQNDLRFFMEKVKSDLIPYLESLIKQEFKRMTYTEAIDFLTEKVAKKEVEFPKDEKEDKNIITWGMDLNSEHEKYITKYFNCPVIVYNYPASLKAFYMRKNDDNKTVGAMDVLVPQIGELIGGSTREERPHILDQAIKEKGLEVEGYWWYRELRKYGSVPHAGFGLGFERMIMMCTGVENIRDVIPFPRYVGNAEF